MSLLEVVEGKLLPFCIPSDGLVNDSKSSFWAASKQADAGKNPSKGTCQSVHGLGK